MAASASLRLGQVTGLKDMKPGQIKIALASIERMLRDVEGFMNLMVSDAAPAAADTMKVLAREPDGNFKLWTIVAGAGVTVNKNATTRVITISAP